MLFLEACTAVMWLTFGKIGYVVGWVTLVCCTESKLLLQERGRRASTYAEA
jgi:hypothetical protein